MMHAAPEVLRTLAERFDATAFDAPAGRARLRLRIQDERDWDATVEHGLMRLAPANGERPDARLAADAATWRRIGDDVRGGMEAFSRGKLKIRDDLHLGVGFLAATSGMTGPGAARALARAHHRAARSRCCRRAPARTCCCCTASAPPRPPSSPPSPRSRATTASPRSTCRASATPRCRSARLRRRLLRPRGGRRARRARDRPRAPGRQQHGRPRRARARLRAPGPRRPARAAGAVAGVAARAPLGAAAARRAPRARPAAARAAGRRRPDRPRDGAGRARGLERRRRRRVPARLPDARAGAPRSTPPRATSTSRTRRRSGPGCAQLQGDALFVWGREDRLVPIGFARHVREALPAAEHLELDCGHVPQLEAPRETHAAVRGFLARAPALSRR